MNREEVYSALWSLLSEIPGFVTRSRRLRHWSEVSGAEQPAIFMTQVGELANASTKLPTKWIFNVRLYLYAYTDEPEESPASTLNPLVDAVCLLLDPGVEEKQDLGGLVHSCIISGQVETDEGYFGPQGAVIIPVQIHLTG